MWYFVYVRWIFATVFGLAVFFLAAILLSNIPLNVDAAFLLGSQILATAFAAGFGLYVAELELNPIWKCAFFGAVMAVAVVLWNIFAPLSKFNCTTDILLFKTSSGLILTPQVFTRFAPGINSMSGNFDGYDEIFAVHEMMPNEADDIGTQNDLKLLAAASLFWMNKNYLDWKGCETGQMFVGLSAGLQPISCDMNRSAKDITLSDLFSPLGSGLHFFAGDDMKVSVSTGSNVLNVKFDTQSADMIFNFNSFLFAEPLPAHIEGTEPHGIEQNIARYYKQYGSLFAHAFRVEISGKQKLLRRWSEESIDFVERGKRICTEYESAFSWYLLKKKFSEIWE
jgi:hypothetical protein